MEALMCFCLSKQYSGKRIATRRRRIYLRCFACHLHSLGDAPAHPRCRPTFRSGTSGRHPRPHGASSPRTCSKSSIGGEGGGGGYCVPERLATPWWISSVKDGKIFNIPHFLLCFQAALRCQALFQGSEDSSVYAVHFADIEIENIPLRETFFFFLICKFSLLVQQKDLPDGCLSLQFTHSVVPSSDM